MNALPILYPPRLRKGATLGVIAPASPPADPEKIPDALARLTAQGFRVKPGKYLGERDGYLAGTDEERAEDFNAFFSDSQVDGIFALRDYAAIRAHPKAFIGYSDITALHHAILKETGLVTFHGPNANEAFLPENASGMRQMLMEPSAPGPKILFAPGESKNAALKTVVPGRAHGRLIGGNLTCLLRLIGTPYAPDFRGAILFLEDIGEKAYRVDGEFTHLRLAGVLGQIAGLVLGRFDHADEMERWRIGGCLQREAERIGVPCVSGAPIGHSPDQITIPHGVDAELDASARELKIDV
jgi:muramoyltetrapeptide carboxypeptidase